VVTFAAQKTLRHFADECCGGLFAELSSGSHAVNIFDGDGFSMILSLS